MRHSASFLALFLLSLCTQAQSPQRPKLVVGLVVDQMRWDFLYRYSDKYSANGFKRLLREGYKCENTHINYSPSYTACGHSCIYNGSVPAIHGITGNNWFDLEEMKYVYCTQDTTVNTVGSSSTAGKMSPRRMLSTSVCDELKLATNFRSKVIGVAIKDRGAILPAGHTADAAYFYDPSAGQWITSTYYRKELPLWVQQFNALKLPEKYLSQNWETVKPIIEYYESDEDDAPYEEAFPNETKPVFTHMVSSLITPSYKLLAATPYGNTYTLRFAEGAILNEELGKDAVTDFLTVSLSSPDYIGHRFGPNSVEAEDCYLRLDEELASFFNFLDTHVGAGNYLFFLTADHGAAHIPGYLQKKKIPSGVFAMDTVYKQLDALLKTKLGEGNWLLAYENMQLYLNNQLIQERKANSAEIKQLIKDFLLRFEGIANVYDLANLSNEHIPATFKEAITNGVFRERSGDLYILYEPNWFEDMAKGTTHGTIYPYDTHIPLVWYGWNVKPQSDYSPVYMTDIAATVAAMLHIQEPSGCIGKPIKGLLEK